MKNIIVIALLVVAGFLSACSKYEETNRNPQDGAVMVEGVGYVKENQIIVKFKNDDPQTKASASLIPELEISSMEQLFPTDPRFRERHMKEGLHLWYVVTFNPETPVTKAHSGFSGNSNIENVEYVPVSVCQEVAFPFDDPSLLDQWHYHNWGQYSSYKVGMDINLLKAWEIETGSESVIVAVVDSGVDYLHPDLADAMWINEAEKSGIPGVDDDNNGYVDDIYGCDLVTKTGDILPEEHGTHVAGIIGAINNNGQFGAGIAGGKNGKGGVRIMNCQMFKGEQHASGASGIVYAADNGAVICNNSWGFIDPDVVSQFTKDAIDYFNKYAGLDADGNQVGAMAGGITIFAAGNDNSQKASPAMYEGVVAVANIDPAGIKASTSNYGEWIDITAPGRIIGSTLPDGGFGFKSGTSMACPHVSGVAALVVSKHGGYGFTGQMLRERILRAADYNKAYDNNPEYIGQLGAGMVDAYMSLMSNSLPDPVGDIDAQVSANIIALTWNATDNNGESVYGYNIYVSKTDLSGYNPEEGNIKPIFVPGESFKPQDVVSYTLTGLEYSTQYYIRIEAVNYFMMGAPLSPQIKVKTKDNQPPVITPGEDISVTLKAQEEIDFRFTVSDPESNAMSYKLTPGSAAVKARSAEDVITVYIEAVKAEAGIYTAILTVSDELGASSSVKITYTILPNNPPVKVKEIENVSLGKGEQVSIDLSQYFTDSDGETLSYVVQSEGSNLVSHVILGNELILNAYSFGTAGFSVYAYDAKNATSPVANFKVLSRDNTKPMDVYPTTVQSSFNVRTPQAADVNIKVISASGSTAFSAENVSSGPFAPYVIDTAGWDAGIYTVEVTGYGQRFTTTIVKL